MMKLGENQTAWFCAMKDNPEQQAMKHLGLINLDGSFGFCILGKGIESLGKGEWIPTEVGEGKAYLTDGLGLYMCASYNDLGLYDYDGTIRFGKNEAAKKKFPYKTLVAANDAGVSWKKIMAFAKKYPELVFQKSV